MYYVISFTANDFFIGAFVPSSQIAEDLDGNKILALNSRWNEDSPSTPSTPMVGSGVSVNIQPGDPGDWTISADSESFDFKPYLCQM